MPKLLENKEQLKAAFGALEVNAEFKGFQSFIDDAEDTLADIAGYEIIDWLASQKASENQVIKRVATLMSKAAAHLGIYIWSKTAMYVFSDKGLFLLKSEKGAILSDKKVQDLHNYCQDAGYNFLDRAVALMEANIVTFPIYKDSPERLKLRNYFLSSAAEFSRYHNISGSRVTYQSLLPVMGDVGERFLPGYLGDDYYTVVCNAYQGETLTAAQKKLLPYIQKAVALITVSEAFNRLPVQLKAGGLFVDSFTSTTEYEQKLSPDQLERDRLRGYYYRLGEDTLLKLRQYLNKNAADYPGYTVPATAITTVNSKDSSLYAL